MTGSRPAGRITPWGILLDAPLVLAACGAVSLLCFAALEAGAALRRAHAVRAAAAPEMARLAAETAVARMLADGPEAANDVTDIGDVRVAIERIDASRWEVSSEVGDLEFRYRCEVLPGAAPAPFAHACSALDPVLTPHVTPMRAMAANEMPRLDADQLARATPGERLAAFRADQGVALLAWDSGTEKPDFVLTNSASLDAANGLVVLGGHLWIEVGTQPLRVSLERDLVLVVRGNVYVGRSIAVDGPGRLVLVAHRGTGEVSFADVDGNGRWSAGDLLRGADRFAGPVEGAGNVYLGLAGSPPNIACDVAIVATGELHVGAASEVGGPLVLANGTTATGALTPRVAARGEWGFAIERERVPGFATAGPPRPSWFERIEAPRRGARREALYAPVPAR